MTTKRARSLWVALAIAWSCMTAAPAFAQATAVAPAPAPAASPAITAADLASVKTPSADDKAKGDPDGGLTGNASDVTVSDSKAGLTAADLVNQVGQNKIAINFVWTLVTRLPGHVHAGRLRDRRDRAYAGPRTPTTP